MPPRTNPFQKLVVLIERRLSQGAEVVESYMVTDRNGQKREVDIAILHKFGAHSYLTAVECRDHAREQDVTWIDSLIGKYRDIPSVNRVIAVSRTGFTDTAREKAEQHGITALSFSQAKKQTWSPTLPPETGFELTVSILRAVRNVNVRVVGSDVPNFEGVNPKDVRVFDGSGNHTTVHNYVNHILQTDDVRPKLEAHLDALRAEQSTVSLNVGPHSISIGTLSGRKWRVASFECPFERVSQASRFIHKPVHYDDEEIGVAEVNHGKGTHRSVIIKKGTSWEESEAHVELDWNGLPK